MLSFPPTFEERGSLSIWAFASLRFGERLERGRIRPAPCEGADATRRQLQKNRIPTLELAIGQSISFDMQGNA